MKKKGFTLIELLVVVAIIALLASVVIASLGSARAKGRDAKRRTDLEQVRNALELYYYSNNNSYPKTDHDGTQDWYGGHGYHDPIYINSSGPTGWIPDLAPLYIAILPTDPKDLGTDTGYYYQSNGTDYKLLNFQTVEKCPVSPSDGMYDPARNPSNPPYTAWGPLVPCTFAVYTPGAANW